jgi:hypothetical protein
MGMVHLGALEDVNNLLAHVKQCNVKASWKLKLQMKEGSCQWQYPTELELLEGESVSFPINMRQGEDKL